MWKDMVSMANAFKDLAFDFLSDWNMGEAAEMDENRLVSPPVSSRMVATADVAFPLSWLKSSHHLCMRQFQFVS